MTKMPSMAIRQAPFRLAVVGLALILFAPIPAFLRHQEWSAINIDGAILGLLCLAIATLVFLIPGSRGRIGLSTIYALAILWFVDFQFQMFSSWIAFAAGSVVAFAVCVALFEKLSELATFVFGLMILLSLIPVRSRDREVGVSDQRLPPIVYLILDEHIGVAGVPAIERGPEIQELLRREYLQRGFRIYENAYSLHDFTHHSLASVLNASDRSDGFLLPGKKTWQWGVRKSSVLRHWVDQGYRLRIYQSDWLDLCNLEGIKVESCFTYSAWSISNLVEYPWNSVERTSGILVVIANRSQILLKIRGWYDSLSKQGFGGLNLPMWPVRASRPGALVVRSATKVLQHDLESNPRGTVFLAHLLHPHSPYVYDANCGVKPKGDWAAPSLDRKGKVRALRESRTTHYRDYFDQLECLTTQIGELIDAIGESTELRDATVLIHGDHGSRLWVKPPRTYNKPTERDLLDTFSTFLAVRGPMIQPELNIEPVPVNQIVAELAEVPFVLHDGPAPYSRPNYYDPPRHKLPLPSIWRTSNNTPKVRPKTLN